MKIKMLKNELKDINRYLEMIDRKLERLNPAFPGKIIVSSGHGKYDYLYVDKEKKRHYIKMADHELVKTQVQMDYLMSSRNKLIDQKNVIEKFIKRYEYSPIESVYEKSCKGRQLLIEPIMPTKEEYVQQWLEAHPEDQNPFGEKGVYQTNRGEYVRSKSEKILADLFYRIEIPYQYEAAFTLYNGKSCYPDFVVLNVRERKTYYWEHFGLASDIDYSEKNLEKLLKYEKSGLHIGDNLLCSFEAVGMPLDVKIIEEKIKGYLF